MSKPLPRPVTTTDLYLAAMLEEIHGLRTDQARVHGFEPGMIQLKETAATPLPDDFPGKQALEAAGIIYLETVPTDGDELVAISGIGKVTAGQILAWLLR